MNAKRKNVDLKYWSMLIVFLLFVFFVPNSNGSDCLFSQFEGRCFKLISKQTAFRSVFEARQMCLNDGWDLAGIESDLEDNFVRELIYNFTDSTSRPSKVYIGLSDVDIPGTNAWMNGLTLSYTNYTEASENYNFYGDDSKCYAIFSPSKHWLTDGADKAWVPVPCCFPHEGIRHAVCSDYRGSSSNTTSLQVYCVGNCSTDWFKYGNNCYQLTQAYWGSSNATNARRDCLAKGADLISYNDANKLFVDFMALSFAIFKNVDPVNFHLGAFVTKTSTYQNFDRTNISTSVQYSSNPLYPFASPPSTDPARRCRTYLLNPPPVPYLSKEPCCLNVKAEYLGCQKPIDGVINVPLDSDPVAIECYAVINECMSNPCQGGGGCTDHINSYTCNCTSDRQGDSCQYPVTPCSPTPCKNDGMCSLNTTNTYKCSCPPGYNGTRCEIHWNLCLSSPCQNGGKCTPMRASNDTESYIYACTCPASTSGQNCEIDTIDECSTTPCSVNSTCINLINKYRCNCQPGYTGDTCSREVKCSSLTDAVNNAILVESTGTGTSYGNMATYQCNSGYKFLDMSTTKTVFCTASNTWNDSTLLDGCLESCGSLPVVLNSTTTNSTTAVNRTVTYDCRTGHAINGNITSMSFTCLPDKTWSPPTTSLACKPRRCPTLPIYPNQHLDKTDDMYGTTVKLWCDNGYVLSDNTTSRSIKCKADGNWTGTLPQCLAVKCPEIQLPDHMTRNTSSTTYGSRVRYSCESDYRMFDGVPTKDIYCDASGSWSDQITNCSKKRCFPLPYVANATPSTLGTDYWTQSVLTCIPGHKFKRPTGEFSKDVMTCQENSWWSPTLTACEPIFCPELNITGKNILRSTDERLYGTVVNYTCYTGYYINIATFYNSFFIQCLDIQEWNYSYIATCQPITCPDPPAQPADGTRSRLTSLVHYYSETVTYECNTGKKFIDGRKKKNIFCNEVGKWNETDVSCKSERCEPVTKLPNSYPDSTNTEWEAVVNYYCNKGYYRVDGLPYYAILCQRGGSWNDTYDATKDCKIKSCPPVESFPHATVNSTTVTFYDTTLQYKCDTGYKYPENNASVKYRWCNEDAKWVWVSRNSSTCQIIHCLPLPDIENATHNLNETHYNIQVNISCFSGYQFGDRSKVKSVVCTENSTWTELPGPCEVVFCPPLPYWSDTVFNTTDNNFEAAASYYCRDGYAFSRYEDKPGNMTVLTSKCKPSKKWVPAIESCKALASIGADIKGVSWESPQASSLGAISCTITGVVMSIIVFIDLKKIFTDLKMMKDNIKNFCKSKKNNKITPTPR